ncbi:MAG: RimK family alpha-L-glutamate ligase [Erysipelotrichaceae bacterium]
MKKGLILTNHYLKSDDIIYKVNRLKEEFEKFDIVIEHQTATFLVGLINNGNTQLNKQYDFILYLDKDKYLSRLIEKSGIRIFNNSQAMEICDDKMLTHLALANHNIKMPKTLSAPLCFKKQAIDETLLKHIEQELTYPLIIKNCHGSGGQHVNLINNYKELKTKAQELISIPHIYQEYIPSSFGKDIRLVLINHKVVASMLRYSDNDFRSNLQTGGHSKNIPISPSYIEVAEKCSKIIGLDNCGIDLLLGENNEPILCEVNSNAFFTGIEKTTDINICNLYVQYIINEIYQKEK